MVTSVSLAIIAGLIFINTIFLVVVLVRVYRVFGEAQKLIEMVRLQISPIIHDLTQILTDVRSIVRTAEKEMVKVEDSITAVRDTTHNIKEFEAMIQDRIERPLLDLTAVISALLKGSKAFWQSFIKR